MRTEPKNLPTDANLGKVSSNHPTNFPATNGSASASWMASAKSRRASIELCRIWSAFSSARTAAICCAAAAMSLSAFCRLMSQNCCKYCLIKSKLLASPVTPNMLGSTFVTRNAGGLGCRCHEDCDACSAFSDLPCESFLTFAPLSPALHKSAGAKCGAFDRNMAGAAIKTSLCGAPPHSSQG
jgi:hypothetical protein